MILEDPMNGFDLAKSIVDFIKRNLEWCELTGENYTNDALWHGRITGCLANVGVKEGYMLALGRKFSYAKATEFLKRYSALYKLSELGEWEATERSSTEIDVIYLDKNTHAVEALCEYENNVGKDFYDVRDNVVKFHAFSSWRRYSPSLCMIGFWCGTRNPEKLEKVLDEIQKTSKRKTGLFKEEKYIFPENEFLVASHSDI